MHRYPPAIGGAEVCCAAIARRQAAQGHEVAVLTLRAVYDDDFEFPAGRTPRAISVGEWDVDGGVRVRRCRVAFLGAVLQKGVARTGVHTFSGPHSGELYARVLRAAREADVVHAHALPAPHVHGAWLAARLARRPFVLTPYFHAGEPRHLEWPNRLVLRRADLVVAVTPSEVAALGKLGVPAGRILRSGIGFEPVAAHPGDRQRVRRVLGVAPDVPLLCFVGRKASNKGLEVLLAALPRLRHRPRPVVALAGPGSAWFSRLALPAGVLDVVTLPEREKTALIAAADLLVLPSRGESFGIVFLEAWAVGTPVLGADTPAVRDALGDAGAKFRPDDAEDLAAQIDAVLADAGAARRRTERGRERLAREHAWDRLADALTTAYPQALPRR